MTHFGDGNRGHTEQDLMAFLCGAHSPQAIHTQLSTMKRDGHVRAEIINGENRWFLGPKPYVIVSRRGVSAAVREMLAAAITTDPNTPGHMTTEIASILSARMTCDVSDIDKACSRLYRSGALTRKQDPRTGGYKYKYAITAPSRPGPEDAPKPPVREDKVGQRRATVLKAMRTYLRSSVSHPRGPTIEDICAVLAANGALRETIKNAQTYLTFYLQDVSPGRPGPVQKIYDSGVCRKRYTFTAPEHLEGDTYPLLGSLSIEDKPEDPPAGPKKTTESEMAAPFREFRPLATWINDGPRDAVVLARWIVETHPKIINTEEIRRYTPRFCDSQRLPSRFKYSNIVDIAIGALGEFGWLVPAGKRAGVTKGRQGKNYIVNPLVEEEPEPDWVLPDLPIRTNLHNIRQTLKTALDSALSRNEIGADFMRTGLEICQSLSELAKK